MADGWAEWKVEGCVIVQEADKTRYVPPSQALRIVGQSARTWRGRGKQRHLSRAFGVNIFCLSERSLQLPSWK